MDQSAQLKCIIKAVTIVKLLALILTANALWVLDYSA